MFVEIDNNPDDLITTTFVGDVIAFACQYNSLVPHVGRDEFANYAARVGTVCGLVAGTVSEPFTPCTHRFGFMQYYPGVEDTICNSTDSAPTQSCPSAKRSEDGALVARSRRDITLP
jgi:hypothetical protein